MSDRKKVSDLLQADKSNWFQDVVVSNAPSIIGIFANFVVIFADYRAYDVIYQLTGSWWKALSASLACAIPFILWEIGWQYNHTTDTWRSWSLGMAGLAFATSIFLGVADFLSFTGAWANWLLGAVVVLTGVHTVVGLLYYYNDPDVARKRHKAQALGTMLDQETNASVAKTLLESGRDLLGTIEAMERDFDPEDVAAVMRILQGKKKDAPASGGQGRQKQKQQQFQPRQAGVMAMQLPPVVDQKTYTIDELLEYVGKSKGEVVGLLKSYGLTDPNRAFKELRGYGMLPDDLSHGNFARLFNENFAPKDKGQK